MLDHRSMALCWAGMNVVNGLEESHAAFFALLGGGAAFSALALTAVVRYLR